MAEAVSARTSLKPQSGVQPRHRCFELADEKLKEKNTELVEQYEFPSGRSRLCLSTRKINARLRLGPRVIVAGFCPFCGEKLDENKNATTDSKKATADMR